jgi:hypothetical protein
VPDQLRHVDPEPVLEQRRSLRGQVQRAAAVGVDHDGRNALRQQRARSAEFRPVEVAAGVGVYIDEAGGHV